MDIKVLTDQQIKQLSEQIANQTAQKVNDLLKKYFENETMSIKETANLLGVSYYKVKKLIIEEKIKTTKDGKRVLKNSVIDFLNQ